MLEIPILDTEGKQIGSEKLDPVWLGGRIRYHLLKQAIVAYRANKRQGTATTKSRGMVHGSSRKLYRQKGTGRARAGNVRTPVRRGGGRAFAKINRDFSQKLNKKMRHLARNSAILAKAQSGTAVILSGMAFDTPATSKMARILKATNTGSGALITLDRQDPNMMKSGRNIPSLSMKMIRIVNAYDVMRARRLVFTPEAFQLFKAQVSGAAIKADVTA